MERGDLDLYDLESWDDDDLIETLNEIERGLSNSALEFIDSITSWVERGQRLTDAQRERAEEILREWNG